jgi:hypothetical protein
MYNGILGKIKDNNILVENCLDLGNIYQMQ